jgi:polyisoprenoid-binding protein YceI
MKKYIFSAMLIVGTLLLTGFLPDKVFTSKKGSVKFKSEAALELINAASTELRGALNASKKSFAFRVRIKSFDGFNSPLQKDHFNENYLMSDQYPEAFFTGKIIEDVDFSTNGTSNVRAKGVLTIHGVEIEKIIKGVVQVDGSSVKIKSSFVVMLSDFRINIPKVVNEKLSNEIKVEVALELQG